LGLSFMGGGQPSWVASEMKFRASHLMQCTWLD
jgi:hypothetical protein